MYRIFLKDSESSPAEAIHLESESFRVVWATLGALMQVILMEHVSWKAAERIVQAYLLPNNLGLVRDWFASQGTRMEMFEEWKGTNGDISCRLKDDHVFPTK